MKTLLTLIALSTVACGSSSSQSPEQVAEKNIEKKEDTNLADKKEQDKKIEKKAPVKRTEDKKTVAVDPIDPVDPVDPIDPIDPEQPLNEISTATYIHDNFGGETDLDQHYLTLALDELMAEEEKAYDVYLATLKAYNWVQQNFTEGSSDDIMTFTKALVAELDLQNKEHNDDNYYEVSYFDIEHDLKMFFL